MYSYQSLLTHVLANGEKHQDRTGVGTTSVFGAFFQHDMSYGFPLLTTKKMHFKSIFAELVWFLRGSSDNAKLREMGCTIWEEWATEEMCAKFNRRKDDLGHVYGPLWRNFTNRSYVTPGLLREPHLPSTSNNPKDPLFFNDQIAGLMYTLRHESQSRRHMVQAWNAELARTVELPPCHYGFQVKCHGDEGISLHANMRSADLFLGVPFNIASYAALLVMLGQVTGRNPRKLTMSFGDLHIYDNHRDQVLMQISRTPQSLPTLEVNGLKPGSCWEEDLKNLISVEPGDFVVSSYNPHPAIKGDVAV